MPHRARDYEQSHRPLIDLITNDAFYVSDEEDGFYAQDDEYLIHPKWQLMIQRTSSRIPRRVQRYLAFFLVFATIAWVGWRSLLGTVYDEYKQEIALMDDTTQQTFGVNLRPEFKDMIHIGTMDKKHLPTDNKRLVVVGDVHGCREELEHLLAKVEFDVDNDHLILTGDIISKGKHESAFWRQRPFSRHSWAA
jgi:hypothetical protein